MGKILVNPSETPEAQGAFPTGFRGIRFPEKVFIKVCTLFLCTRTNGKKKYSPKKRTDMNRFSCNKYQIVKMLLLAVLFGVPMVVQAQDSGLKVMSFMKINEQDTLIAAAFRAKNEKQIITLIEKLSDLDRQQYNEKDIESLEEEILRLSKDPTKEMAEEIKRLREEIAQLEKHPDSYWENLAKGSSMSGTEFKRKSLERRQKSIDSRLKYDDTTRQRNLAQLKEFLREAKAKGNNKEAMYAVKRQIAALTVDGRPHNYEEIRSFRYGRAAVAIRQRYYSKGEGVWTHRNAWGFVDEDMRLVIPCIYELVFDFNNYKSFRSEGVYEKFYDRDDRPWTTVYPIEYGGGMMGMIDRDGKVVIPMKFASSEAHHSWIEFVKTPWGEFAPVTILKNGKFAEGIIDRNGNYTLKPTYDHIVFYDDLRCFGTTGKNRIYFDPHGNKIEH